MSVVYSAPKTITPLAGFKGQERRKRLGAERRKEWDRKGKGELEEGIALAI